MDGRGAKMRWRYKKRCVKKWIRNEACRSDTIRFGREGFCHEMEKRCIERTCTARIWRGMDWNRYGKDRNCLGWIRSETDWKSAVG